MCRFRSTPLFLAMSLAATGAAWAQSSPAPTAPTTVQSTSTSTAGARALSRADAGFLKEADHAGRTEIEASGLAMERATHAQVKAFAKQMTADHAQAGQELKTLAKSKGVDLPGEPSLGQKAKIKLLGTMKGASFDRQYADEIGVAAHEDSVKLFRETANNAVDADVKAYAAKTLPKLEQHLVMARQLKQTVAAQPAK